MASHDEMTASMDPTPGTPLVTLHGTMIGHAGRPIAGPLDITIAAGDRVIVTGDNGSGKSTLLRTITGLLPPLGGEVDHGAMPAGREKYHAIAHLDHDEPCYPLLTVAENLRFHAALRGIPRARVDQVTDLLGLGPHLDTAAQACSRGTLRRAGLAIALLGDPRLLVIDEPETGLDATARAAFRTAIRERADTDHATIVATHDPDAFAGWTTRHLVVADGGLHESPVAAARPEPGGATSTQEEP